MPLLFSQTQRWLSDLKAVEVCQKQAEAVSEKPATSRLFNACRLARVSNRLLRVHVFRRTNTRQLPLDLFNARQTRLKLCRQ